MDDRTGTLETRDVVCDVRGGLFGRQGGEDAHTPGTLDAHAVS